MIQIKSAAALQRLIDVRPKEVGTLAWSWLYVFALFLAYYVLRPIREELGVASGVDNLPWLFTGTLLAMIALNPLYSYAVKKWPREIFIAVSYRFFMVLLLIFMLLLFFAAPAQHVWIGRAFFIFVSVFNLFVVSIFWSLLVDVFSEEQGKRLFGFIAAGATMGGIAGSAITSGLVEKLGQSWLLVISILLLEVAVFASRRLSSVSTAWEMQQSKQDSNTNTENAVGGSILSGLVHTFRSPYLLGITFFMLFNSITSTFLYFQQAGIAEANFQDRAVRTAFFADIDLWVNVLTLVFQLFLAGRLLKLTSVGVVLSALPLVSIISFSSLAYWPTIVMLVIVQVVRRVSNFGLSRPTREILFISLPREDRYKAKNFIDTVIYRGGDQVGSWVYAALLGIGLGIAGISLAAVPLSAAWLGVSWWLGKQHRKKIKTPEVQKTID